MPKKILICFMFALSGFLLSAQDCAYSQGIVSTKSGLIIRESPGKGYVGVMPQGDTLSLCYSESFGTLTVDGIEGHWRKIRYRNLSGYAFDGFVFPVDSEIDSLHQEAQKVMSETDSILGIQKPKKPVLHPFYKGDEFQFLLETYNYCGDVSAIDLSLYWYGIFMDSELNPDGKMEIRPLDLKISLSKEKVGQGMEFDILTDQEERSLFLIGSNKVIQHQSIVLEDVMKAIQLRGKRLFPGQELILNKKDQLRLSATGQILSAGPCPEAKDYRLMIKAQRQGQNLEQNLADLIPSYGKCAIPELYWYGDLSGDGQPELIFVSVEETENTFHLLQSNPGTSELFSVQAVFRVVNCLSK